MSQIEPAPSTLEKQRRRASGSIDVVRAAAGAAVPALLRRPLQEAPAAGQRILGEVEGSREQGAPRTGERFRALPRARMPKPGARRARAAAACRRTRPLRLAPQSEVINKLYKELVEKKLNKSRLEDAAAADAAAAANAQRVRHAQPRGGTAVGGTSHRRRTLQTCVRRAPPRDATHASLSSPLVAVSQAAEEARFAAEKGSGKRRAAVDATAAIGSSWGRMAVGGARAPRDV